MDLNYFLLKAYVKYFTEKKLQNFNGNSNLMVHMFLTT